jgi:hypothetical protein
MRIGAALAILLSATPGPAVAQTAKTGSIKYNFLSLLIPEQPADRSRTVKKRDPWFEGKVVPGRAVVLDAPVAIPGTSALLEKGEVLSVATSAYFVACGRGLSTSNGLMGMGRSPVCLIDMDEDGVLDSWYKSSVDIIWNEYSGHIQRDDIHPIAPTQTRALSIEELRKLPAWSTFTIKYAQGMLTYCIGISDICLQKSPKIKPSAVEQVTGFKGGLFGYRKLEDGRLAVRMVRDPKETMF